MKIAILGTRGIPNNYGGFEQFAECISVGLVNRGHQVTVYSPHFHPYKNVDFKGVSIRYIYCPEKLIGAAAHFIYDWLCLQDALKQKFDVIYEAGYHSNAPSYFLMRNRTYPVLVTNMDGLEWKRSKWNYLTRKLIKRLERLAVARSHYIISDNLAIQQYYKEKYNVDSYFIAYGANPVFTYNESFLNNYGVTPFNYFSLVARLEPENNIEMIIDGYLSSGEKFPFLVIGNYNSKYGAYLKSKYKDDFEVRFLGGVYNKQQLDSIRHFSLAYFHGHTVGGTNPSLLEAMACESFIIAHHNPFNKSVLDSNALYFDNRSDLGNIISKLLQLNSVERLQMLDRNLEKIKMEYSWDKIVIQNEELFLNLLERSK